MLGVIVPIDMIRQYNKRRSRRTPRSPHKPSSHTTQQRKSTAMSKESYEKFLANMYRPIVIAPCLDESQYVIPSFRKTTSEHPYYQASTKALVLVSIVKRRLEEKYGNKIGRWCGIGSAYSACPSIFVTNISSPRSLQKRNKFYIALDKRLAFTKDRFPQ